MLAIHVNSSAPFFAKRADKSAKYSIDKFELYNTVLSALVWRRLNGGIKLVADKPAYEYYKKLGILDIWNSAEATIISDIEGINPLMFWAAGKLLALRDIKAPVAVIDTDFIIWQTVDFKDKEIIVAHREDINPDIYPDPSVFAYKEGYMLNKNYRMDVLPCNTAFLYIKDESFKQFYTNMAIEFMKSVHNVNDNLCYMVFAEQRMLSMCAEYLKKPVTTLLDKDNLFEPQSHYTHLWGAKSVLKNDLALNADFCETCRKRILTDFPEYSYIIKKIG